MDMIQNMKQLHSPDTNLDLAIKPTEETLIAPAFWVAFRRDIPDPVNFLR